MTDIICAKCGKHFSTIELAREHQGNCKVISTSSKTLSAKTQKFKITPDEWERLVSFINISELQTLDTVTHPENSARSPSNLDPGLIHENASEIIDRSILINPEYRNKPDISKKPENHNVVETYKICPTCKIHHLLFNVQTNKYECLKCKETYFKVTIDKYYLQLEEDKNKLDELSKKNTKVWFRNQYYDTKKKKWRTKH